MKRSLAAATPPSDHSLIRRLAIFRALQLGDMLCAVPALRSIRAGFPEARITLVGLPWAEAFAHRFSDYLDEFMPFPGHPDLPEQPATMEPLGQFLEQMQAREFDLAIQLHGSGRISNAIVGGFGATRMAGFHSGGESAMGRGLFIPYPEGGHESLRLSLLTQFLGLPPTGTHLEFPLCASDFAELHAADLDEGMPSTYLCVHPGARDPQKCWPPECFAEVADELAEEFGLAVVLTGSGKERELAAAVGARMRSPTINAAAPISIGAMAALMSQARLLICNDTGVSHIADGLGLPSVVVFTRSDMQRWAPLDSGLHHCVWDPEGDQVCEVLRYARQLMQKAWRSGI